MSITQSSTLVICGGEQPSIETSNTSSSQPVGGWSTPASVVRYIKEQPIHFYARGLKPGAKVHVFFDGQRVTDRVIPGSIANTAAITPTLLGVDSITLEANTLAVRSGANLDSQAITVANNGTIAGVFYLPGQMFLVGDREFAIADVTSHASIAAATTYAQQTFRSFNFNPQNSTSTRAGQLSFGTSTNEGVTTEQGLVTKPVVLNNANNNQTQANAWIKLYTNTSYGGVSRTFYGHVPDLSKTGAANGITNWDNRVYSVEVSNGSTWTLYEYPNLNKGAPGGIARTLVISSNISDIMSGTYFINGLSSIQLNGSIPTNDPVVSTPSEPIIQTFTVTPEMANSREGVYLSSLQLYFKEKDSTHGVSVELRETVNGYPSNQVLPFGRKWKPSSAVNTSNTGATATTFTFDNLIYLRTGQEYCFAIIPDACSPNYEVWTAETGSTDLSSGTVVRQDWGNGKLFQATNNQSWNPLLSEDVKFTLKQAIFTSNSGYVVVQNKDYEYFTISTSSNNFVVGEQAFKVVANLAGSITTNTANLTVSGVSTVFQVALGVGDYITIPNANTAPTQWDLVKVANIVSNTELTLARYPRYAVTSGNTSRPPVGKVDFYNTELQELHLVDSTAANSNFWFANGDTIIGSLSGANAVINVVTNKVVSYFKPLIGRLDPASTNIEFKFQIIDSAYNEQSFTVAGLNSTNYLNNKECIIASRSNEIANNGGQKSFVANIIMTTGTTYLSPFIDLQNMSVVNYNNIISANNTNEHLLYGSANSKYISSTVILGANQEAEDIRLFVTAFRPANTDVEVYAKILNASDPEPFDGKVWTKLEKITANNLVSDASNVDDLIEMEYTFPTGPVVYGVANGVASVSNSSASISGVGSLWHSGSGNNVLAVGDVIKIVDPNNEDTYDVQYVTTVTNNTSITVGSNVAFTSTGAQIYKLQIPNAAFLYEPNDKVVRYFSNTGGAFDGYRTFALKVVLLSDSTYRVPRVSDIRSIALSV